MEKEDFDIGEFRIKLLQDIEALTLHAIEQEKKNTSQSEDIKELKNK